MALHVLFLPGRRRHGGRNRLKRHGQPVTALRVPGVQENMVEQTKKPAPHTPVPPPELALSQGPFETVLDQIVSGSSVARECPRITTQMGQFAANQPLQCIHVPPPYARCGMCA